MRDEIELQVGNRIWRVLNRNQMEDLVTGTSEKGGGAFIRAQAINSAPGWIVIDPDRRGLICFIQGDTTPDTIGFEVISLSKTGTSARVAPIKGSLDALVKAWAGEDPTDVRVDKPRTYHSDRNERYDRDSHERKRDSWRR